MSLSLIGYKNFLEEAIITSTTESTSSPVINIADWLPYDWYKPNAIGTHEILIDLGIEKEVDYISIFSHDLGQTSSTVKLQYDNDGLGTWIDASNALTSDNGQVIFEVLTPFTKRYLKLVIDANVSIPSIGIVSIGKTIEMQTGLPVGFIPAHMAQENQYVNSTSDTGLLLGRSLIRKSNKTTISAKYVTPEWVRDVWVPFLNHAQQKPFFFSWDHEKYPEESVFCVTYKKIAKPKYTNVIYMSVSLKVEAWYEL